MKIIKKLAITSAFMLVSFSGLAQSITASGATLDAAEAAIAQQAKQAGASYKITSARFTNGAYISAELIK
ncbi:YdgH/BhsA/McbA-like domain containing protein [Pantoea latae]|uniref:DUF1471 domain-containing protein n=1 Tax=Pantoea latae TaxID=1964541 RepID=A0A1V9DH99_9GAMM|nr:YdgH/BhsA/McbA-like domain containing protein [Pantoea latae]OQP33242.1 DUF1471 domain-containing protein [Pantoea latae]